MLITIDQIHAEHTRLGHLIAQLQTPASKLLVLPEVGIELHPGERYAGLVLDADGRASHHLLLLPGETEDASWDDAKAWAATAGGELPTRQEQALLYANLKAEFKPNWYWSSEQHASDSSAAWGQDFYDGNQDLYHKSYAGRSRAVRRFPA